MLLDLAEASPAWMDPAAAVGKLSEAVLELEYTLIPHGLHVVGEAPSVGQRVDMLLAVADASHGARPDESILEALVTGEAPEVSAARADAALALYKELAGIDRILAAGSRTAGDPARARRPLHSPGTGRRPAAHAGDPADRAAICMASIRSAFPAPLPCRTAHARPSG